MKRIIALPLSYGGALFHPEKEISESPSCYGTELAIVEVFSRIGKIAQVDIFIQKDSGYSFNKWNINWKSSLDWDKYLETTSPNVIIVCRYLNTFIDYYLPKTAKIILWAHDPYFLPQYQNMHLPSTFVKNLEPFIDQYLCVGKYQFIERLAPPNNLSLDKYTVIRNGITLEPGFNPMIQIRKPLSFIWASCWTRGLKNLLERWSAIRNIFPQATLKIYYTKSKEAQDMFRPFENDNSIDFVGKVTQPVLFNKLKETEYLLYWCNNFESCCNLVLECAYYGVLPFCNMVGGLRENLKTPCLIDCPPYECDLFFNQAISIIMRLENNHEEKIKLRQQYFDWSLNQTWDARIPAWKNLLEL